MRRYIDMLAESSAPASKRADQTLSESRVRKLLNLKEGELIPLPGYVLRISGSPYDFYQLMKMTANPNLAHKINYKPTGSGKGGANVTDITMVFYDKGSYEEAKKLFDYFKVPYTDEPELSSEMGRQAKRPPFKTDYATDNDEIFGQYITPNDRPVE